MRNLNRLFEEVLKECESEKYIVSSNGHKRSYDSIHDAYRDYLEYDRKNFKDVAITDGEGDDLSEFAKSYRDYLGYLQCENII